MGINYDRRTAAGKLDPISIREIKRLTDSNNHAKALIKGAEMLKATLLSKKLSLVSQLQDLEGSLPRSLGRYRDDLHDEMMKYAKRSLSPEEYKQFYNSF